MFEESTAKSGNAHQNQGPIVTCTFSETFEENGEVLSFTGSAQVVRRP